MFSASRKIAKTVNSRVQPSSYFNSHRPQFTRTFRSSVRSKMRELRIRTGPKATLVDSPIPRANPDQVVIKVVVAGANPKDWKYPERFGTDVNQGEDMAGFVHETGANVTEFKVGDRVAAFHEFGVPNGAYAEYAVAWAYTTFHIPENITFEEAATVPLSAMTAAIALFSRLALPQPWSPIDRPLPLIIYGASSAVGCYAVQLAKRANIHPLILIAGRSSAYVETLLDHNKGDTVIDYRSGPDAVECQIRQTLKRCGLEKEGVSHAFDVISERGSWKPIVKVLNPSGALASLRPVPATEFPSTMHWSRSGVAAVHAQLDSREGDPDFGYVFFRLFSKGLKDGWLKGHPREVRSGGLNAVEGALKDLKEGRNNATKYVFRIDETEQ